MTESSYIEQYLSEYDLGSASIRELLHAHEDQLPGSFEEDPRTRSLQFLSATQDLEPSGHRKHSQRAKLCQVDDVHSSQKPLAPDQSLHYFGLPLPSFLERNRRCVRSKQDAPNCHVFLEEARRNRALRVCIQRTTCGQRKTSEKLVYPEFAERVL